MEGVVRDVGHALRTFRRRPASTAIVVGIMALAIGATTAAFSLVNGVLLRPLDYAEPDELYMVWAEKELWRDMPIPQLRARWNRSAMELREYDFLREAWTGAEAVAGYGWTNTTITYLGGDEPRDVEVAVLTENLLETLGVAPALGRGFTPADERGHNGRVTLLSHAFWRDRLGADPAVVGRAIALNGEPYTVVGVMPPGFAVATRTADELWFPMDRTAADAEETDLYAVARVPAGSLASARSEAAALASRLSEVHEDTGVTGLNIAGLHGEVVGDAGRLLGLILAAVALVLLVACANVAALLLARGLARRRELGIRSALGAGRRRLTRQLLTENMVLMGMGGIGGILLAVLGTEPLLRFVPAEIPRLDDVVVDGRILGFGVLVTMASGLLVALLPAIRFGGLAPRYAIGERGATDGGRAGLRVQRLLVVVEVAVAMLLLTGAGLLVNSYARLSAVPSGMEEGRMVAASIVLPSARYTDADRVAEFYRALGERVRALPGVEAAGFVGAEPFAGDVPSGVFRTYWEPVADTIEGEWETVTPGFFEAAGIERVSGRDPGAVDPASNVAWVNELAARSFWPEGDDPEGDTWNTIRRTGRRSFEHVELRIVGVVRDARYRSLHEPPAPTFFRLHAASPIWDMTLLARSTAPASTLRPAIRNAVAEQDPVLERPEVVALSALRSRALATERAQSWLLGAVAGLAVILSLAGLYSVVAFHVGLRSREIGIRIALGARPGRVRRRVVGSGLLLAAVGIVIGLGLSLAATRTLESFLFGVEPVDPPTMAAATLLLLLAIGAACLQPALRASRVDPREVLQAE